MKQLHRRAFLRLGSGALVGVGLPLGLTACSDGDPDLADVFVKQALPQDPERRWWLSDNYAPVMEERDAANLKVVGQLPRALNGVYARNGSNGEDTEHWFLGHGMLHGIRLQDGAAQWYRNRYTQTALRDAGIDELTPTDPVSSYSNVAVVYHADKLLTLGEIGLPYQVEPADLSTVGVYDFDGLLNGSMTAHPKIDPTNGHMLFFGYDFVPPFLTFYEADATGRLIRAENITLPASVMIHDFAITRDYVLFYDLPVAFDINLAVNGSSFPYGWDPEHVPRIGVMPRSGGDADIVWFEVENCFIFHTMNAYQNPANAREVVLHCSRIAAPFWDDGNQDLSKPSYLTEYRFDLDTLRVSESRINEVPLDFGQLNKSLTGSPYRYGYGLDFSQRTGPGGLPEARGVIRHDHQTGSYERHNPGDGLQLGEALFVSEPGATGELDGWLLSVAFNEARNQSDLLVIDARDFTGEPVARVELPYRIPFGFHGIWVPD